MMSKPAIIIPAYSRPKSLKRLLKSINNSVIDEKVNLIFSVDGGADKQVIQIVEDYNFPFGIKKIIKHQVNLGLRRNILTCGDLTAEYGSAIILEDDLYVDKYFYFYAKEALNFYKDDVNMAGIALYSPKYNEFAKLPFEPLNTNLTGYFMQTACSWGQAWSKKQWQSFKEWYTNSDKSQIDNNIKLPTAVKNWPESSWKKYFACYLTHQNLFIYYPYRAYTTNCSKPGGTHDYKGSNIHQVPLSSQYRQRDHFKFESLNSNSIKYDSFMETQTLELFESIGYSSDEIAIDIYGTKPLELLNKYKYTLTSKYVKNYISCFALGFRPIEFSIYDHIKKNNNNLYLSRSANVQSSKANYFKLAYNYSNVPLGMKSIIKKYINDLFIKK